jgi:hypothetical protein
MSSMNHTTEHTERAGISFFPVVSVASVVCVQESAL